GREGPVVDAHQNGPGGAQNDGPGKCAEWSMAWGLRRRLVMRRVAHRAISRPSERRLTFVRSPPEAYFRPDRRTSRPTRAAAVKDGRHVEGEACSSLPGRSLRAASTAAHCGGSGPESATRTAACHTDAVCRAR